MDLIAVVFDFRQCGIFVQRDLDRFRQRLLAAKHHGMFHGCIQVAFADFGWVRARRLQ